MKKLSWFNKVMLFFNMVLTVLTFVAYILPFLAPNIFPILSVFTLLLPLMLVFNFLFFLYWLLQFKKQMLLSGIVLLLGITFISKFYKFSQEELPVHQDDFTLMSYNVRMFNLYKWVPNANITDSIKSFVRKHNPDVLCFQEYAPLDNVYFNNYKHKYIFSSEDTHKTGQAIYSKFPIVSKGDIKFPNSSNNVIYADLKKGNDTIRVYSMHMQSIKISPDIHETIDEEKSKVIFKRLSEAFTKQQLQAELIEKHKKECKYPVIICGDLNNSAFSYVYRSVKGDMNDVFEEVGSGFGKSYNFKYYPARIDYVFSDDNFEIKSFTTFDTIVNSDHFPIMARMAITPVTERQKE
ncbi:endonuclease/exonuclease/phosphatase family protein [Flavobacterium salilacus subsp. salilacus]|uniref:endonuclease/exonuclease/phosphatase family protein n=1 Tax=Flavobacterium TaxID=237 RepID=UPI001075484A|nr:MULTISPECIES: endonuclease/exonuclease/phosphatase family protein [Flavobacterium]KAF2519514.1 endonuclease/exonuclease/phosphatase family protein [Flavobacterium salilacus subsp. salilacus]MBE1614588.1 endonuclease/exonuclease/phosphatase family protein [Flavobacterium sp. SaA2.13]